MKAKGAMGLVAVVLILAGLWAGVGHAAALPPMHVGGIQMGYWHLATGGHTACAVVAMHDLEHMPVPGAVVTAQWTVGPGEGGRQQKALTNFQGLARFQIQAVEHGPYWVCVRDVMKAGWIYAPSVNELTCASVTVW